MKTYVILIQGVYSMLYATLIFTPMRFMLDVLSEKNDLGLFKVLIISGTLAWPFFIGQVTARANLTIWRFGTKNSDVNS